MLRAQARCDRLSLRAPRTHRRDVDVRTEYSVGVDGTSSCLWPGLREAVPRGLPEKLELVVSGMSQVEKLESKPG